MTALALAVFTPAHLDQAIVLWRNTEHMGFGESDARADLERYLARNHGCSFVALSDSKLVGTVLAGHDGRRGTIYHLATSTAHRRTGVASKLLDAALAALAQAGVRKCNAFVYRDNPHADLFWARTGWQQRDDLHVFSKVLPASRPSAQPTEPGV